MSVSVGIIGAGSVVRERHLPVLNTLEDAELVWIADPDPAARANAVSLSARPVRAVPEPGPELAGTDAVLIATPPATHAALAIQALEGGCHVLCEKPLALNEDDCDAIEAAAGAADRTASVAFNLPHHPAFKALHDALAKGALGRPLAIRSCSSSPGRVGAGRWVGKASEGGDVLWEIATHHADLWRRLLGSPLATASASSSGEIVAISGAAADGTPVSAVIGWGAGIQNEIEVLGDRARARASFTGADPLVVIPNHLAGSEPASRLRGAARALRSTPAMVRAIRSGGAFHATYRSEWEAFLAAIGGAPNESPLEAGREAVTAIRLIRKASGL